MGNSGGQAAFNKRHELGVKWVDNLGTESVLEFQPGTRWAYSPVAGLDIAVRIVEITSGKSFDAFTRERLFGPLGMKDTFFWPSDAQRQRLVGSYTFANGKLTPRENPDAMSSPVYFSGGGGLMSSAESYARFAMMLANGGELNGVRVLSQATVKLMGSQILPDTLPGRRPGEGYGLGVRHVNDNGRTPHPGRDRQLRLERRLRHALLGGPEAQAGGDPHAADPGDRVAPRSSRPR